MTIEVENVLINHQCGIITEKDREKSIDEYSLSLQDPNELYNSKNMLFNGLLIIRIIFKVFFMKHYSNL